MKSILICTFIAGMIAGYGWCMLSGSGMVKQPEIVQKWPDIAIDLTVLEIDPGWIGDIDYGVKADMEFKQDN